MVRGDLEHWYQSPICKRVRLHGRKEAHAVQMRIYCGRAHPVESIWLQRIQNKAAEEAVRIGCDRGRDTFFVAMHAGNERSAMHAVPIEFSDPALRERGRIACRDLPSEQGPGCFGIFELLLTRKS